jgi:hypothetical protein
MNQFQTKRQTLTLYGIFWESFLRASLSEVTPPGCQYEFLNNTWKEDKTFRHFQVQNYNKENSMFYPKSIQQKE